MTFPRRKSNSMVDRKTAQLCAQVERALHFIIPEILMDLPYDATVSRVLPAPNASHLMVVISIAKAPLEELKSIESTLMQRNGFIRTEVARSIHRRKTPNLSIVLVPS